MTVGVETPGDVAARQGRLHFGSPDDMIERHVIHITGLKGIREEVGNTLSGLQKSCRVKPCCFFID